jgi:hypothetical protein
MMVVAWGCIDRERWRGEYAHTSGCVGVWKSLEMEYLSRCEAELCF